MHIPENLRYSVDHEWAAVDGDSIRVGITDYAQDALGDVVYVDLPEVGDQLEQNAVFGEVESTKSVSELYAPMSGTVESVNEELFGAPQRLNEDPYGEGWICTIAYDDLSQFEGLLDAAAYQELIEGEG